MTLLNLHHYMDLMEKRGEIVTMMIFLGILVGYNGNALRQAQGPQVLSQGPQVLSQGPKITTSLMHNAQWHALHGIAQSIRTRHKSFDLQSVDTHHKYPAASPVHPDHKSQQPVRQQPFLPRVRESFPLRQVLFWIHKLDRDQT